MPSVSTKIQSPTWWTTALVAVLVLAACDSNGEGPADSEPEPEPEPVVLEGTYVAEFTALPHTFRVEFRGVETSGGAVSVESAWVECEGPNNSGGDSVGLRVGHVEAEVGSTDADGAAEVRIVGRHNSPPVVLLFEGHGADGGATLTGEIQGEEPCLGGTFGPLSVDVVRE